MTRKEKTYKFLAIAEGWEPIKLSLPPEKLSRLMKIKALRSDSAEKIARQRMEKLEKQTGCKWTLHNEPPKLSKRELRKKQLANTPRKPTRTDKILRIVRLLGKIKDEVISAYAVRACKELRTQWFELQTSQEYAEALPYVKALIGLGFAVREIGNTQALDELIESAIKMTPLFLSRFDLNNYDATITALKWFKSPQSELKGKIPWMIMNTEYGRRRVRKAMIEEFGSHCM
jgi:hypothetical protein